MRRYVILIMIFVCSIIANYALSRSEIEVHRISLDRFPTSLSGWRMIDEETIENSSMAVLLVDDYFMRTYVNEERNRAVNLYVGYFQHQREGKQVHSPRQCLPGAGFVIERKAIHNLELPGEPERKAPINLLVMRKGDERRVYLWWYQGRGRIYASEYLNKYYQIMDIILRRRSDGALVRVDMNVEQNIDKTLEELLGFIEMILPLLPHYIPE